MEIKKTKSSVSQSITRYPLLLDTISIVYGNVIEGIIKEKPIHIGFGYDSLIKDSEARMDFSVQEIKNHISQYRIIYSDSAISSSYVRFEHPQNKGIFEQGEFICTCKSGYFHFKFSSEGALEDVFSDFYSDTPEFIYQLFKDFPDNNYDTGNQLLDEIKKNGLIDNIKFLDGLNPHPPIVIEIE
jgi:hypothetical protein